MSDTPMTDEAQFGTGRVSVDFARRLERELTEARDLLGDMAFELKYLFKQFDPSGKNHDWNDARKLFEKYKTLEKRRMNHENQTRY